ncbi:MAG: hypothetical protein ACYC75_01390 [Minisyncoccota bacterium]
MRQSHLPGESSPLPGNESNPRPEPTQPEALYLLIATGVALLIVAMGVSYYILHMHGSGLSPGFPSITPDGNPANPYAESIPAASTNVRPQPPMLATSTLMTLLPAVIATAKPLATFENSEAAYSVTIQKETVLALARVSTLTVLATGYSDCNTQYGLICSGFDGARFSPLGDYLQYDQEFYEDSRMSVYDIAHQKVVFQGLGLGHFNATETVYYICNFGAFGGDVSIGTYQVPGFTLVYDPISQDPDLIGGNGYYEAACAAVPAANEIIFTLSECSVQRTFYTLLSGVARVVAET